MKDLLSECFKIMGLRDSIVFCDTQNTIVDEEYAEKLRQECRKQLRWEVKKGTRIYNELTEFSKGYSKEKRDVSEVFVIFRIANNI